MQPRHPHEHSDEAAGADFFYYEGQSCYLGDEPFTPLIAQDMGAEQAKKEGFNTLAIKVPLLEDSDLLFNDAMEASKEAKRSGLRIVYDLDLGLFGKARSSLESDAFFSYLQFSLRAFREKVLKPYSDHIIGLIAFKGSPDFYSMLRSDFKLLDSFRVWLEDVYGTPEALAADLSSPLKSFSEIDYGDFEGSEGGRFLLTLAFFEMAFHFIERLGEEMPANSPLFLLLDFSSDLHPSIQAALLNRARLGSVLIAPRGAEEFHSGIRWEERREPHFAFFGTQLTEERAFTKPKVAILLPPLEKKRWLDYKSIGEITSFLRQKKIPFRMIPEPLLPGEWDDIETLIISSPLTKEGRRKVMGYLATEGNAVSLNPSEDLPLSANWQDWKDSKC